MPWGSFISAGTSAWGAIQSNKNIDKQLESQRVENQKNRHYNLELAKLQNQWNRQQWQMENAYSSPAAQMERMRQAGLNPDMMYGGGLEGNISAASPEMTAGVGSSPMDWSALGSKKTIGDVISQSKQLEMLDAQIANVKADTDNKAVENDILKTDASYRAAILQGEIDLNGMKIKGIQSDINVNDEQISKMRSETAKLDQECQNLKRTYDLLAAQIDSYQVDIAYKKLRMVLESKETEALIAKMAADTNKSKAECKAIVSRLPWELLNIKNEANLHGKQADYVAEQDSFLELQNDVLTWQFGQDKTYDDWKRSIGIAGDVINGLEGLASIIGMAFGSGKPTRVRGFGK